MTTDDPRHQRPKPVEVATAVQIPQPSVRAQSNSLQEREVIEAAKQRSDWASYFWLTHAIEEAEHDSSGPEFLTVQELAERVEKKRMALETAAA